MEERNIGDVEILVNRDTGRMSVHRVHTIVPSAIIDAPACCGCGEPVTVENIVISAIEYDGPIPPRPDARKP